MLPSQLAFVRHHGVEYRRHRPALPVPRLEDMRVTAEMRERYHRHRRRRIRGSRLAHHARPVNIGARTACPRE